MRVAYEWTAEQLDEHGDIIDNAFADRLADLASHEAEGWTIGLVRDAGDDLGLYGTEERQWAYPTDGNLPERFDGGSKVPQKYHAEWRRARERA